MSAALEYSSSSSSSFTRVEEDAAFGAIRRGQRSCCCRFFDDETRVWLAVAGRGPTNRWWCEQEEVDARPTAARLGLISPLPPPPLSKVCFCKEEEEEKKIQICIVFLCSP